jgi:hypothetical protein
MADASVKPAKIHKFHDFGAMKPGEDGVLCLLTDWNDGRY